MHRQKKRKVKKKKKGGGLILSPFVSLESQVSAEQQIYRQDSGHTEKKTWTRHAVSHYPHMLAVNSAH